MRRALLILGLLAALALLAGFGCTWLSAPRHTIDTEHVRQITEGMTGAEVEALLGAPGGFQASPNGVRYYSDSLVSYGGRRRAVELMMMRNVEWVGQDNFVTVIFDARDRVVFIYPGVVCQETFLDRVRRWV